MSSPPLQERVTALETELQMLKQLLTQNKPSENIPWWEQRFGAFANSPEYDEASRLGREYRKSLRPPDEELED